MLYTLDKKHILYIFYFSNYYAVLQKELNIKGTEIFSNISDTKGQIQGFFLASFRIAIQVQNMLKAQGLIRYQSFI